MRNELTSKRRRSENDGDTGEGEFTCQLRETKKGEEVIVKLKTGRKEGRKGKMKVRV